MRVVADRELSINYHISRRCNYSCHFCFHRSPADGPQELPVEDAKKGLRKLFRELKAKGHTVGKLNFSGGEPFLATNGAGAKRGSWIGEMVRFLHTEFPGTVVSIVSNGSLITEEWLAEHKDELDILAISIDSFNEETCKKIGRSAGKQTHVQNAKEIRKMCGLLGIEFKVNTVVCKDNMAEDMADEIKDLDPLRWKVFQCLFLEGENTGPNLDLERARKAKAQGVTDGEFLEFKHRHGRDKLGRVKAVFEDNETMKDSYLILNEELRFLNCKEGGKKPGPSILEYNTAECLAGAGFDLERFHDRDGAYYTGLHTESQALQAGQAISEGSAEGCSSGGGLVDMEDLGRPQTKPRPTSKRAGRLSTPSAEK